MIEQPFLRTDLNSSLHSEQLLLARNRITFLNTGVLFLAGYGESLFYAGKTGNLYQPYWSFQLVTKGSMLLSREGKETVKVKEGDFFLTRPGHHYIFEVLENVEKRYIMVSHGVLVTLLCEQGYLAEQTVITDADIPYISHVFDTIRDHAASGGEDIQRKLSAITYDFLLHLPPENASLELPGGLSRIIEDIHANIAERITLKNMSAKYGIGERTLNRLFQKYMNCSPVQYVIRTRMMYAQQMLQSEGLGIGNIAKVCGYRNTAFFVKEFRRIFSCTPGEYRKNQIISQQKVANYYLTREGIPPRPPQIPGLLEINQDFDKRKKLKKKYRNRKNS
ncbi:MAG: helix-turn-helix transcriptional regulator [Lentisphaeria bacterium]|nr:helix-turn-helix transcriptional regulator [Lentisphaeria bacterium]